MSCSKAFKSTPYRLIKYIARVLCIKDQACSSRHHGEERDAIQQGNVQVSVIGIKNVSQAVHRCCMLDTNMTYGTSLLCKWGAEVPYRGPECGVLTSVDKGRTARRTLVNMFRDPGIFLALEGQSGTTENQPTIGEVPDPSLNAGAWVWHDLPVKSNGLTFCQSGNERCIPRNEED